MKHITTALFVFLFSSSGIFAQMPSPGGVEHPNLWMNKPVIEETIGNHKTIDLQAMALDSTSHNMEIDASSTAFLVLKPKRETKGKPFLNIGELQLFDNKAIVPGHIVPLKYSEEPCIFSVQFRKVNTYAFQKSSSMEVVDTSLFHLAELIIYPRILNRVEMRKVSTYLALKYSITITENSEDKWKDYWTPDEAYYWDQQVDHIYNNRVMALGRSDEQLFYQSQTTADDLKEILFSLGDTADLGEMPLRSMEDNGFIIFSEKVAGQHSKNICPGMNNQPHPLENWKFHLQNWHSEEKEVTIRIRIPDSQKSADSLFLYDGSVIQYLSHSLDEHGNWIYKIDLTNLKNNSHYFFKTQRELRCWEELLLAAQQDSLNEPYSKERLSDNQYLLTLNDGESSLSIVVRKGEDEPISDVVQMPVMEIFPTPAPETEVSTLLISQLPENTPVYLKISDSKGKIVFEKELAYRDQIIEQIRLNTPGLYTIIASQGDNIYTLKHIILNLN